MCANKNPEENVGQKDMQKAYAMANDLLRDRLRSQQNDDLAALDDIKDSDILVVNGTYDHIYLVLKHLNIPHKAIAQDQLMQMRLSPEQTIFVNCASSFPEAAARQLATFVHAGGMLITTDWALKNVLEVGFPGYVKYNGRPSADEVVRIELVDKEDEVLKGFLDEESDPVWWLEGSSYPIAIEQKDKVDILMRSNELKEKYGEEAVIIRFNHGKGTVYHMISHFYLQRTETREANKGKTINDYAAAKGAAPATAKTYAAMAVEEDIDYESVQSASTSAEFVSRIIIKQKKRSFKK